VCVRVCVCVCQGEEGRVEEEGPADGVGKRSTVAVGAVDIIRGL